MPQTTCVTSRPVSAPAESRPAVVNVISALQGTGDSQCVDSAAVITTRHLASLRQEYVLTVSTIPRGRTVKCVRLVTMVMLQVVSGMHCRLILSQLSFLVINMSGRKVGSRLFIQELLLRNSNEISKTLSSILWQLVRSACYG